MKAIHFLLGLVLYSAFIVLGLAIMLARSFPCDIQLCVAFAKSLPQWIQITSGVLIALIVPIYFLTGALQRRKRQFIKFYNDNGTVSVSTDAVRAYLDELKAEFAAALWLKSSLRVTRGALEVGIVLGVRDGTQIPELCKLMQVRVREVLESHLGTCELAGVSIEVNEIRSRKKQSSESAT